MPRTQFQAYVYNSSLPAPPEEESNTCLAQLEVVHVESEGSDFDVISETIGPVDLEFGERMWEVWMKDFADGGKETLIGIGWGSFNVLRTDVDFWGRRNLIDKKFKGDSEEFYNLMTALFCKNVYKSLSRRA